MAPKKFLNPNDLFKELRRVNRVVSRKIIRVAFRAGALVFRDEAKKEAPKGETGALEKHITVRAAKRSRSGIGVNVQTGTRKQMNIAADAKGYYPAVQEFGSAKRNIRPVRYMRRSFQDNVGRVVKIIGNEIADGIAKEFR